MKYVFLLILQEWYITYIHVSKAFTFITVVGPHIFLCQRFGGGRVRNAVSVCDTQFAFSNFSRKDIHYMSLAVKPIYCLYPNAINSPWLSVRLQKALRNNLIARPVVYIFKANQMHHARWLLPVSRITPKEAEIYHPTQESSTRQSGALHSPVIAPLEYKYGFIV